MTFLPILERELRVRARSRANHWARFAVGGVGVLIGLPPLVSSSQFIPIAALGRGAFNGLVSAAFMLCCAACLLTADTLSRERRDGTLGLLLLTKVRSFEVLLGKLASSGLAAALGLAAILPVLTLPLLAGGVTGGEAFRKGLVLVDTLFLALSAGLWASAAESERVRAARRALLAMGGLVLGPVLLTALFSNKRLLLLSPIGGMIEAADSKFSVAGSGYWLSLALVQAFAWALLWLATRRMRGGFPHRQVLRWPKLFGTKLSDYRGAIPAGTETGRCGYCGRHTEVAAIYCPGCGTELRPQIPRDPWPSKNATPSTAPTPLHWLLGRRFNPRPLLWAVSALACLELGLSGMSSLFLGLPSASLIGVSWAFSLAIAALSGSTFAWVASRFFVEARRTGELELLATTPLGAEALVSTQWKVLKGWITGPVLLMATPPALSALFFLGQRHGGLGSWSTYFAASMGLRALHAVFCTQALCWVGLWCGLRTEAQGRAILWTLLLVEAPPFALSLAWAFIRLTGKASPPMFTALVLPVVSLLFFRWLTHLARRQLRNDLASAEPMSLRGLFAAVYTRRVHA